MGKAQRTKGAAYECEVAKLFTTYFAPHSFERNIGQTRDGGNDIDVGPLVVECKRRKSLATLTGWMRQAKAAAARRMGNPSIPVVVMRADGGENLVLVRLPDFLRMSGDWIQRELGEK